MHPAHYDTDALVTAVLEIDLPGGSFTGPGFYVQPSGACICVCACRV